MTDKTDIGTYTIGARRSWGSAEVALPALPDGQALLGKVEAYWCGLCSGNLPPIARTWARAALRKPCPTPFFWSASRPGWPGYVPPARLSAHI